MLSGSAIVRVSVLLVAAGLLAALAQFLWLRGGGESAAEPPTVVAPPPDRPSAPEPPSPVAEPAPAPDLRPPSTSPPAQAPPPIRESDPAPASGPAPAPPSPTAPDPAAAAQVSADPRAVALVDLNSGTLAQLNGLKGGGNIGRAIIQKRPYASVDQLLSKRVLSRATYERIKDQVAVQ
jgi:pyruvate/2-oxoglutarate dehydrogenase complex dihydrolipoamide acyltransferase (E2) component